jgi:hypothetical protein
MRPIAFALLMMAAAPALAAGIDGKRACVDLNGSGEKIIAQDMTSSRSLSYDGQNASGGYDLLVLWVQLTDANSSITTFRTTCTVSNDGNTTDYTPQVDEPVSGVATQVDAGIFDKASPGSKKWTVRLGISGYPDFECTFSVQAGAGAGADLLTVNARLCTEGG